MGTSLAEEGAKSHRTCLVTNHTVTIPLYHISIILSKPVNCTFGIKLQPNTFLEIEANPFLSIEQLIITIMTVLQRLGLRIPDSFMAALWNPGGHTITLKRNTTISYAKESDCIEKSHIDQQDNAGEVTEISHEKLVPMPEKSAFMFSHTFYPQTKIDIKDLETSEET